MHPVPSRVLASVRVRLVEILSSRTWRRSLLAILSLSTIGALAAAPTSTDARVEAASEAEPWDTVAVFGPRELMAGTGRPALHVERFEAEALPGTRFWMRLENGAEGGGRVRQGSLRLNGRELVSSADLARMGGVWEREVSLNFENTLEAEIEGRSGARLIATILRAPDPTFAVFGPELYERMRGAPERVTKHFLVSATAAPPYKLHLINGDAGEQNRVNSAVVRVAGVEVVGPADLNPRMDRLSRTIDLAAGENMVEVEVHGAPGANLRLWLTATDTTPPVLAITAPPADLITRQLEVDLAGSIDDETVTRIRVNDAPASVLNNESFSATVPLLVEGENQLAIVAIDAAGNRTDSLRTIIRDTEPPVVLWSRPSENLVTRDTVVQLSGTTQDLTRVTMNVNGAPLAVGEAGDFLGELPLVSEGVNFVTLVATDQASNATSLTRQVTRDTQPPVITVNEPASGTSTESESIDVSGTVLDLTAVTLTLNGQPAAVTSAGEFTASVPLEEGPNSIAIEGTDAAGNTALVMHNITREPELHLPPDPADVAPALDRTVATMMHGATSFLYTGENPIQTGVAPETIEPLRASVIRGRLLTRDGEPLPGVEVTVLGHPELGQTLSRLDGRFDLAVNGGGTITLNYELDGHFPAQRPVYAPWQNYTSAPDVVLVPFDPNVTTIDFANSNEVQVARGSVSQDIDGARQATMLFEPGTDAHLEMPDGSLRPVGTLNIRATEYTVGESGPQAMPAVLPPVSGYTYAVELSADEAIAVGARHVRFSKPVAFYLENFLDFPVGEPVPFGWYDRENARWVADKDGRIIEVLSIDGGSAQIDVDGDGAADSESELASLGLDAIERERLARLYSPGESLWRVEMTHMTTVDLNYSFGLPGGATAPPEDEPDSSDPTPDPCPTDGSIIECENQTLGERVGVLGTAYSLNYRSAWVSGNRANRTLLDIPLSGPSIPGVLQRIELVVEVAGQRFEKSFRAAPNQSYTYTWDGLDAYGREVQGSQDATVYVGFIYAPVYYRSTGAFNQSFASASKTGVEISAPRGSQAFGLWRKWETTLSRWDARGQGLGGWTFDVHHNYEIEGRTLRRGDGSFRTTANIAPELSMFARIGSPRAIIAAPDGGVYVSNPVSVYRIDRDGVISRIAGTGALGYNGDGIPARSAQLNFPDGLALGPDGSLYVVERVGHRIRRISPDGIITTIAGTGLACDTRATPDCGNGGPADAARFIRPEGIDIGVDGSIYIADTGNRQVRRIDPSGMITAVAGVGAARDRGYCYPSFDRTCGDGGMAASATMGFPNDVAVGPDGSLYITQSGLTKVRKVDQSGRITTVVGTGDAGAPATGSPATASRLPALEGIDIGPDGSIYLVGNLGGDRGTTYILQVGVDGILRSVPRTGDNPPTSPTGIALSPSGDLFLADHSWNGGRIQRLAPSMPGGSLVTLVLASEDGGRLYHFDGSGRHLKTIDAFTGAEIYDFDYDAEGLLSTITDGDGLVTAIERGADGAPLAIVAPHGQRTLLQVNADGYLSSITNPASEALRFAYDDGGLLISTTTPRGHTKRYAYDDLGWLIRAEDAVGTAKTLTRTQLEDGFAVALTSPMGRTTTYAVETLSTGDQRRTITDASGQVTTNGITRDGRRTAELPDGTVISMVEKPDPRFGAQSPILKSLSISTPGGRRLSASMDRYVTLAQPNDPMSLTRQVDRATVNGRISTTTYEAGPRRYTAVSPESRQNVAYVDSLGRILQRQIPGITGLGYEYDALGRLTRTTQGERTWAYTYDEDGHLASATDPLGRIERYAYDAAGRLTVQTLPDEREIQYAYDANGNLTVLSPPSRRGHAFSYTATDLAEEYAPPALGAEPVASQYSYTADKQVDRITRPDGSTIEFGYDKGGRVDTLRTPHGSYAYGYDPTSGNLLDVAAPDGAVLSFTYDGSLPLSVRWSGEVSGSVGASYNNNLWVRSQSLNGGNIVDFSYDRDGLLTGVGALSIGRNPQNGLLTGTTLGGVTSAQSYSAFGELADLTFTSGSGALFETSYTRDLLGRITTLTETSVGEAVVWGYRYDKVGRLVEVSRNGAAYASYEYDGNGNRTLHVGPNGTLTGTYDVQDRLLSYGEASYGYSAAGELKLKVVADDTTRYTYDVLGNLRAVALGDGTEIEYLIDPSNRRIGTKVDGILVRGFLYQDQLNPVAELDGAGNVVSRFVYGTKPHVPDYLVRGADTYRIVSDHLGSVRLVVNAGTGEVAQRIDYDAFGRVTRDTHPGFQPFGYAGGLYEARTGLVRFGARDYDPHTGRWTSKDPIGFRGLDANLFRYVLGDPVNFGDDDGQIPVPVIGGIIGAGFGGWSAYQAGADVSGIFQGVFVGGVTGALATIPIPGWNPALSGAAMGAGAGLVANLTNQIISDCPIDWTGAAASAGAGALGGLMGGPFGPGGTPTLRYGGEIGAFLGGTTSGLLDAVFR